MPLPPGFSIPVYTTVLPLTSRTPGTYSSGILHNDFGGLPTADVEVLVYVVSTASGAGVSSVLETSADGVVWSEVPGTRAAPVLAAGSSAVNAAVPAGLYVRVSTTVTGGPGDVVVYRVLAVLFPTADA